jgi:DNA-3-methyladenine glycosylase II
LQPSYWEQAINKLSKKDKKLAELIFLYSDTHLQCFGDPFKTLANAIVGQQISVAAANAIWQRLLALFPKKKISPKAYLKLKEDCLQQTGLSKQKILYLKNIANHFINNKITPQYFKTKSSEEIAKELLAIKGIGKWTLEMFQIFYLNEPDIFPIGDIGLIKAVEQIYPSPKLKALKARSNQDLKDFILEFSKRWQPYRTVATWYLWRTIDAEPVHY